MAQKAKVYGERHSGTNLLTQLLARHTSARVLPGTIPRGLWVRIRQQPESRREHLVDAWDALTWRRTLGWKHAYLSPGVERRLCHRDVGTVALVKHPLAWTASMRRRPYHLRTSAAADPIVRPLYRERLPAHPDDFRDIWHLKTSRYLELQVRGLLRIVRFEDLVADPVSTFEALCAHLGIEVISEVTPPTVDIKGGTRDSGQIARYYAESGWRSEITPRDLDWYASLDRTLLSALDYDDG